MSCPSCFTGTIHDGVPSGTEAVIHGLPTYIASPPSSSSSPPSSSSSSPSSPPSSPPSEDGNAAPSTLLPLFDTLLAPPTTLLAKLLKPFHLLRLFLTIIPFQYRNRFALTFPRVERYVRAVRRKEASSSALPLGAAGYCWGGRHVTVLASLLRSSSSSDAEEEEEAPGESEREGEREDKLLIDAAYTAHPGGLALPTDILQLKAPWSMAIGDDDFVMPLKEVTKVQEVLAAAEELEAARTEVVVYRGAKHGFAVRGNPGDEGERRRGVEAREQCLSWFARWFARV
ncbi:MAG: hypothetical protein Q9202_005903 [Teloschistes flavicans]